jgi:hypothetical protein
MKIKRDSLRELLALILFVLVTVTALSQEKNFYDRKSLRDFCEKHKIKIECTDAGSTQKKEAPSSITPKFDNQENLIELVLESGILQDVDLRGLKKLKVLKLANSQIRLINDSNLPLSITEISLINNSHLAIIDLGDFPAIKHLTFSREICKLERVLLHKENKAEPGITKIVFERDEKDKVRLEKEEYFDEEGKYKDHVELRKKPDGTLVEKLYAQRKIEYKENGRTSVIETSAEYLNESRRSAQETCRNIITDIVKGTIITIVVSIVFSIIGTITGITLVYFYTRSKKVQDFLSVGLLRKIFTIPANASIIFSASLRCGLLAPSQSKLIRDADLDKFKEKKYYSKSKAVEIVDGKKGEPEPIISAIDDVKDWVVLKGLPGSGKTMFIRHLLKNFEEKSSKNKVIPVYLLASKCQNGVAKAINEKLVDEIIGEKQIKKLVKKKTLTVFIDALNEAETNTYEEIYDFIKDCSGGNILLSTQLTHIEGLPGRKEYELMPLDEEQIEEFLISIESNYEDRLENYKEHLCQWVTKIQTKLTDPKVYEVLSNPKNLTIVGKRLAMGKEPGCINVLNPGHEKPLNNSAAQTTATEKNKLLVGRLEEPPLKSSSKPRRRGRSLR